MIEDDLPGKERIEITPAGSMEFVAGGGKHRVRVGKASIELCIFTEFGPNVVYFVVVFGVAKMYFMGRDTNYGTWYGNY